MRLLGPRSTGLLREGQFFRAPSICVASLIAVALTLPVLGDESCVPIAADASNGENVCVQTDHSEFDAVKVDETINAEEETERPIWWDMNIDQLFEDYFDCGSIIYGYQDEIVDNNDDNFDDDDDQFFDGDDDNLFLDEEDDSEHYTDDEDVADDRDNPPYDDDSAHFTDDEVADDKDNRHYDDDTDNPHDNQNSREEKSDTIELDNPVSDLQLLELRRQWAVIREKYVKEINLVPIEIEFHEKNDPLPADDAGNSASEINEATIVSNRGVSAMVVPTRVGDAGPGKGRGVYATEPIPKGTLVNDLDNGSTGIFKEGHSWLKFAATLPRATACNFIEWCWVQTVPPENEFDDDIRNGLTIFIAFDESNLLNAADWDGVEANIRCGRPPEHEGGERGPCRFHYYAARDIAAGEELLINYHEFEDLDQSGWTNIGL